MKFSIPYNGYNDFMKTMINEYGGNIEEIYLAPSRLLAQTGRSNDGYNKLKMESSDQYESKINEMMAYARKKDVGVNMLFNGSFTNFDLYTDEGIQLLYNYINPYYQSGKLTGITLIDPYLMEPINKIRKTEWPELKIHASVNMYGNAINRIQILEELGMDTICIDRDINRDMDQLHKIRRNTRVKIKVMVNEGCLLGCPFRKYHHERKEVYTGTSELLLDLRRSLAERFEKPVTNDLAYCLSKFQNDQSQIFRSPFIRPEDLHHYDGIADVFKIVGREMSCERLGMIIKAYMSRSFEGNLWSLVFRFSDNLPVYINNKELPEDFHDRLSSCAGNCINCGYCNELNQLVSFGNSKQQHSKIEPGRSELLSEISNAYEVLGRRDKAEACQKDEYPISGGRI